MIAFASAAPGVFEFAPVTQLRYDVESTPSTAAPLAEAIFMNAAFADTLLMIVVSGFQPIFVAVTSAWIVCVGRANTTKTFAPDAFRANSCCVTFGAVASYGCALTILLFFAPRPTRNPA